MGASRCGQQRGGQVAQAMPNIPAQGRTCRKKLSNEAERCPYLMCLYPVAGACSISAALWTSGLMCVRGGSLGWRPPLTLHLVIPASTLRRASKKANTASTKHNQTCKNKPSSTWREVIEQSRKAALPPFWNAEVESNLEAGHRTCAFLPQGGSQHSKQAIAGIQGNLENACRNTLAALMGKGRGGAPNNHLRATRATNKTAKTPGLDLHRLVRRHL